jgi:hypothetical protein
MLVRFLLFATFHSQIFICRRMVLIKMPVRTGGTGHSTKQPPGFHLSGTGRPSYSPAQVKPSVGDVLYFK